MQNHFWFATVERMTSGSGASTSGAGELMTSGLRSWRAQWQSKSAVDFLGFHVRKRYLEEFSQVYSVGRDARGRTYSATGFLSAGTCRTVKPVRATCGRVELTMLRYLLHTISSSEASAGTRYSMETQLHKLVAGDGSELRRLIDLCQEARVWAGRSFVVQISYYLTLWRRLRVGRSWPIFKYTSTHIHNPL